MNDNNATTQIAVGQYLELYYINGKREGMVTAKVSNWNGQILKTPRTPPDLLTEALKRPEAQFSGVYLLAGEQNDGSPRAYIGEGEDMSDRIRSHVTTKDWWTQAVMVTSQANTLNKAHFQYLESRLIREAKNINRVTLDNDKNPKLLSLGEAEQAGMEVFLDRLLMVFPALGIDAFEENKRPNVNEDETSQDSPIFELHTPNVDIRAQAIIKNNEFIVLKGSQVRESWVGQGQWDSSYAKIHNELVKNKVLKKDGKHRVFTQNVAFSGPRAAGAVVNGRSTAGVIRWKVKGTNKTYRDWEAEQINNEEE